jgi:hypothetical protein
LKLMLIVWQSSYLLEENMRLTQVIQRLNEDADKASVPTATPPHPGPAPQASSALVKAEQARDIAEEATHHWQGEAEKAARWLQVEREEAQTTLEVRTPPTLPSHPPHVPGEGP